MAPKVIEFNKTLLERRMEFEDVFPFCSDYCDEDSTDHVNKRIMGCQIKDLWKNHLSVVLRSKGWKAVWKVPFEKCHLMSILYPSNVLVEVLSTDLETFSATVEVLSINDRTVPASERNAALIELFPIDAEYEDIDAWTVADELDKFRFFFEQVWYPWDETDDASNWPEAHLKSRFNLLYDMITGEMNSEDAERIRTLVTGARRIQVEMERTEAFLEDYRHGEGGVDQLLLKDRDDHKRGNEVVGDLDSQMNQLVISSDMRKLSEREESLVVHLISLQQQMEYIQHEVEVLADPSLRTAMTNEKRRMQMNSCSTPLIDIATTKTCSVTSVSVVCAKANIHQLKKYLDLIESKFGGNAECEVVLYPSLQHAIDVSSSMDRVLLLCPGVHRLRSTEEFLYPGTFVSGTQSELKSNETTIFGHSMGKVIIIVDWKNVKSSTKDHIAVAKLENLCFDPHGSEAVLLVDNGTLSITNCFFGHRTEVTHSSINGNLLAPCTSVLDTYSTFKPFCKAMLTPSGDESPMALMPPLPLCAAFPIPPHRGIAVGASGILSANNCHFEGLHLGIIIYSGAKVRLVNCTFSSCRVGIRISKDAEVVLEKCIFENSKVIPVHVLVGCPEDQETPIKELMGNQEELIGSSQLLRRIPGIRLEDCSFGGSSNDVLLSAFNENKLHSDNENSSCNEGTGLQRMNVNESDDDDVIILD